MHDFCRRLVYNGRNNMQTRGLIVLLISKAAGHLNVQDLEQDKPAGVSHRYVEVYINFSLNFNNISELDFEMFFKAS